MNPGLGDAHTDRVEEGVAGVALQLRDSRHARTERRARAEVAHARSTTLSLSLFGRGSGQGWRGSILWGSGPVVSGTGAVDRPDTDAGRQLGQLLPVGQRARTVTCRRRPIVRPPAAGRSVIRRPILVVGCPIL